MIASKICPSCGAQNDLIFTNCVFCKSSLPHTDINSITNDDLIMKASEWVTKSQQPFIEIKDPNSNDWTGRGIKTIAHGEILSYAEKYLSLLKVRSLNNPTLAETYHDLSNKLSVNKIVGQKECKKKGGINFNKPAVQLGLYVMSAILIIAIVLAIILDEKNDSEGIEKEKARLENILFQINEDIANKNYDAAEIKATQLRYAGPDIYLLSGEEAKKAWDETREQLLIKIERLKRENQSGYN